MAYSSIAYVGDGATTIFNVPFPYLLQAHVHVYVDNVEQSYTWVDTARVQLATAPANSSTIVVKRTTPPDQQIVNFVDGSVLGETDLDASVLQMLYIAQENTDLATNLLYQDVGYTYWDAQSKPIKNVSDPVDPQDVATKNHLDTVFTAQLNAAVANASASASAAASSATNSANSAAAALNSENNAAVSEQNAATSASNAAASEAAAQTIQNSLAFPTVLTGDSGKRLKVNATENGYELYNETVSSAAPSGGNDGDFWFQT